MEVMQRTVSAGLVLAMFAAFLLPISVQAASLTTKSDVMTSLKAATVADHTILFTTPTGVASGETIILTFTSFSIAASLDFDDLDLSSEASGGDGVCDTGDTHETLVNSGATASEWNAVRTSGTVITFTSGGGSATIAAGAEVCIEIGTNAEDSTPGIEQITNPGAGSYSLAIAGSQTDSGDIAITIIADDQVVNTGTVDETLAFSISDVAIGFGTLTSANARYATADASGNDADPAGGAHTITAGTNGTAGYTLTVTGSSLGGPSTITAMATEATSSAGSSQYGIRLTVASGPESADVVYDDTPSNSFALVTAAFPDTIATASGASADTVFEVHYLANITSATVSGAYTSTLTYILVGNF